MRKRIFFLVSVFVLVTTFSGCGQVQHADHSAVVPVEQTAAWAVEWWMPRHKKVLKEISKRDVDLIFVGDSITHGWEDGGKEYWDKYYAPRNAVNMGFSGDRTEHVLWRFDHGEIKGISPKLAVLMIGTNNSDGRDNTAEEIADGIKAICAKIRSELPDTKILMLRIFPRGEGPSAQRQKNTKASELASKIADNDMIFYMDINEHFLDDGGRLPEDIMPDLLHPNEKGYRIWAEAIESTVARLMGEPVSSVETIVFDAPSVGRSLRFNLVLPKDYGQSEKRYPVLYLLHGYGGNYTGWIADGAADYAAAYDLIIVVPDSGNSWYANWKASEDGKKNNWEDYIVKDVVGYVDSHYRTISRRQGRAIGGLSMGGYGAVVIGLRNPEMFCSVASHSGALSYGRKFAERLKKGEPVSPFGPRPDWMSDFDIPGFGTYSERSPRGQIITSLEEADAIDVFKLVVGLDEDKRPDIYIGCGRSDFLFDSFKAFGEHLRENNITHTSRVSDGAHTHEYWAREVRYSMAHQYQVMQRSLSLNRKELEGL